jgi:hypothetical protein
LQNATIGLRIHLSFYFFSSEAIPLKLKWKSANKLSSPQLCFGQWFSPFLYNISRWFNHQNTPYLPCLPKKIPWRYLFLVDRAPLNLCLIIKISSQRFQHCHTRVLMAVLSAKVDKKLGASPGLLSLCCSSKEKAKGTSFGEYWTR